MKKDKTKINEILEKIFNMRTINKRITKKSLNQNNEKLKKIYELLGKPCENKKIIHIAGTNGKGSTATFLENIFISQESGFINLKIFFIVVVFPAQFGQRNQ